MVLSITQDQYATAQSYVAAANNITAINLTATTKNTNLGNGNVEASAATFIRTDGSSGELVEVSSSASALDLQNNSFYRQFPSIAINDRSFYLKEAV